MAARTAMVLPTPTSPVTTPSNDSAMQNRMRATASWWEARSSRSLAEMLLENGSLVKPKWADQSARVMPSTPYRADVRYAGRCCRLVSRVGRGRPVGRGFQRHAPPGPDRGSPRRLALRAEAVAPGVPDDAHADRG